MSLAVLSYTDISELAYDACAFKFPAKSNLTALTEKLLLQDFQDSVKLLGDGDKPVLIWSHQILLPTAANWCSRASTMHTFCLTHAIQRNVQK